jgi:prepilin-type processing-associated H-X9-DG protein
MKSAPGLEALPGHIADGPDLLGTLAIPPLPTPEEVKALLAGGRFSLRAKSTRSIDITDGLSNTFLLIDDAGRPQRWVAGKLDDPGQVVGGAGWADPGGAFKIRGDIQNECFINCKNVDSIYSFHSTGANLAFADGSVRFLSTRTSVRTLVALRSAKSGDVPGDDW